MLDRATDKPAQRVSVRVDTLRVRRQVVPFPRAVIKQLTYVAVFEANVKHVLDWTIVLPRPRITDPHCLLDVALLRKPS